MKKILFSSLIAAFLFGCMSINAQQQQQQPVKKNGSAKFVTDTHDFGNVNESGGLVSFVFEFTNVGTDPLVLKNVQASCGCTTPDWPREPILPGKKGIIKVTYNPSGRPGSFDKTITVYSDGTPDTQMLKIKGYVVTKPAVADTMKKK